MSEEPDNGGTHGRPGGLLGEDWLGRLFQELFDNPTLGSAVGRAFEARGKATQAQQTAMGLLGIPTAGDVERLTRRVRAVAQRIDAIEDGLARIEDGLRQQASPLIQRLEAIEAELASATRLLAELAAAKAAKRRKGGSKS
jgi:hypothetical protein